MQLSEDRLREMAREGRLHDARVASFLDELSVPEVISMLGHFETRTEIWLPLDPYPHWRPGEPQPVLADDRPEVNAAMSRCLIGRFRDNKEYGDLVRNTRHPEPCGWCDYPSSLILAALTWSAHWSRFITGEWHVWTIGKESYRRGTGRAGQYDRPTWEAFRRLGAEAQTRAVDVVVAHSSRADG